MSKDVTALNGKIAYLETQVDMLESELSYLNILLMKCGFPQGVNSLKNTVEELLADYDAGIDFEDRKEESS